MSDSSPRLNATLRTCNCHIHIYDGAMPIALTANGPGPAWAKVAAYRAVQQRLGVERAVVVQPTAYCTDNSCTVAAFAELGLATTLGVAVVEATVSDAELRRLRAAGMRGARFQLLPGRALPWDMIEPVAARFADLGWHIQLQMDGRLLCDLETLMARSPCMVVIDHVGKFLNPVPVDHPGFKSPLRLLDLGTVWLMLSATCETSRSGPLLYADVGVLAKHAAKTHPEQTIWASNWPHVPVTDPPDDAKPLDLLLDWVPGASDRQRILSTSPAILCGF